MSTLEHLPSGLIENIRQTPIHPVLIELSEAAREARLHVTPEFRKLVAYLLELADGRDRREPWVNKPGVARPVPKLRIAIENAFGVYADLNWFKLNRTTNGSGQPLTGLFPRMAASLWRIEPQDFGALIAALLTSTPDASILRYLQDRGGKVKGLGVEVFSRLAFAYRRDLYFVIPRAWGETSGCLQYVDNDLRRYCALCRNLRSVCDELGLPGDIRGSLFDHLLQQQRPPRAMLEALHKAIGPALSKYSSMDPSDAYAPKRNEEDQSAQPMEFAVAAIRGRRGRRDLREKLCRACGERCAMTGSCVKDLLEVAYVIPFPSGDVHALENAMLLRSDIHTLWDLNLIGVEPQSQKIYVSSRLSGTSYEKLAGRTLLSRLDGSSLSGEALRERWRLFANAHPKASAERPAPAPSARAVEPRPVPQITLTEPLPRRAQEQPSGTAG
jgi:hypothetical protein